MMAAATPLHLPLPPQALPPEPQGPGMQSLASALRHMEHLGGLTVLSGACECVGRACKCGPPHFIGSSLAPGRGLSS